MIPEDKFLVLHYSLVVLYALVVELVDTQDLKSCIHCECAGSSPARGTLAINSLSRNIQTEYTS